MAGCYGSFRAFSGSLEPPNPFPLTSARPVSTPSTPSTPPAPTLSPMTPSPPPQAPPTPPCPLQEPITPARTSREVQREFESTQEAWRTHGGCCAFLTGVSKGSGPARREIKRRGTASRGLLRVPPPPGDNLGLVLWLHRDVKTSESGGLNHHL